MQTEENLSIGNQFFNTYTKLEIHKSHNRLIKAFLIIMSDIKEDNYNITDESYSLFRKKILDLVNDETRNIHDLLAKFDLKLKEEK